MGAVVGKGLTRSGRGLLARDARHLASLAPRRLRLRHLVRDPRRHLLLLLGRVLVILALLAPLAQSHPALLRQQLVRLLLPHACRLGLRRRVAELLRDGRQLVHLPPAALPPQPLALHQPHHAPLVHRREPPRRRRPAAHESLPLPLHRVRHALAHR